MRYEIYSTNNEKRVRIFDKNIPKYEDYLVNKDKEGREYFPIPNVNNPKGLYLFSDRIKDSIDSIKKGYGDVLIVNNSLSIFRGENVYRYIDRKYGEKLREKTIKGWERTKFGYGLKFGFKNSLSGGALIDVNKKIFNQGKEPLLTFNNKKEAENFKINLLKRIKILDNKFNKIKNNPTSIKTFIANNLEKDGIEIRMIDSNEWYLDIVQIVLNN